MFVRVLGQVEVTDGRPCPLAGPTQRRVLAAMALMRNQVVSVPQLVEVIWGERRPPIRAEHDVRTYVHRLRTSLRDRADRIETAGVGYRMRLATHELDADLFEQLTATVSRLAHIGDRTAAYGTVDEAERLWRGRPLQEFEHETWAIGHASRLARARSNLTMQRASLLIELGRGHDAIPVLEALIRDEPLHEGPRGLLMRALDESGRHAEALRAFQDFRRSLIGEIGVEPSSELVALDRAITSGRLPRAADAVRTIGGYELHERIGEGPSAVVYRATQTSVGRDVAVKVVRPELANSSAFIRRFEAAAQMIARIEHPHVVPLYDFWRGPDQAFLVMRWMSGGSMETRFDTGPQSIEETCDLVDQIAEGLDAAHQQGVVHRNVKPANILFDADGRAYLGDFGITLDTSGWSRRHSTCTDGSPTFAAPEQLRRDTIGPEADVHALAVVAYTLLVGRPPFSDVADEATSCRRRLHDPIPSVSARRPLVPSSVDGVLSIATAKLSGERYATAGHFARALRSAATSTHEDRVETVQRRVNPYRGLRAFDETDAANFHGRARLVEELIARLERPDAGLLAVVGASGSGKSSVVRAGLIPAIRDGRVRGASRWFVTTMIPGTRPFESLETALLRVAVHPPASLLEQLRDGDRGLLRNVRRILPDDDGVVAIVVDQFEELFTRGTSESERDQFMRALTVAVTDPSSPVRIILTLRADFYDRPLRHPEFAALLKQNTVVVTPLAADELERAIVVPAAGVGVGFEAGLVAEIISDVDREPGALPLLQYALTQAFDAVDGDAITIDDYDTIGRISGAVARRAEEVWQALDHGEQRVSKRLFGRLVTLGAGVEDTRRRVQRSELGAGGDVDAVLERFGRARLLTFDVDPVTRETTVEVAHEALIREWPRLRDWLDEDRDTLRLHRHLTAAAVGWSDREREPNELYRGPRLAAAEHLLTGADVDLNTVEHDFLVAAVMRRDEERANERRRVRRLRRLVTCTAVIAAVALVTGGVALVQWRHARDQASAARAAAVRSDVDRLISQARNADAIEPTVGILLGVEAHRLAPSFETNDALHWALTSRPSFMGSLDTGVIGPDITVLDDGESIVVHTLDSIETWNTSTRSRAASWPGPPGTRSPFDVRTDASADGEIVVAAGRGETQVADGRTGRIRQRIVHDDPATAVALSADSERLAVGFADGSVTVHDLGGGAGELARLDWDSSVNDLEWLPDGTSLVIAGVDGAGLWDLDADAVLWRIDGDVAALLLSAAGDRIVVSTPLDELRSDAEFFVGRGRAVRVIATDTGDDLIEPIEHEAAPLRFDWLDDDETVVVGASATGPVTRFDVRAGVRLADLGPSPGRGSALGILPKAGLVATAGRSSVDLRSFDGAGPLSRLAPLSTGQRSGDQPFLTGVFDDDEDVMVTAAFVNPELPQRYELAASRLHPTGFAHPDGSAFHVIVRSGPFTTQVTDDGFEVWAGIDDRRVGVPIPFVDGFWNALSPRGDLLALQSGRRVIVKDVASGRTRYTVDAPSSPRFAPPQPVFSPSGSFLHVSTGHGAARFDSSTGEPVWSTTDWGYVFPGPDDRWVVSAEVDGSLRFRDPTTLETTGAPLIGHVGLVRQFYFNPRTGLAVTAADDDVARVWDTERRTQLGRELPAINRSLRFWSPDGSLLALPVPDGYMVWNYDTSTWADVACATAGRNLTRDEWAEFGPRSVPYRATCEQYPADE